MHALRGKEFVEYDNPYDVGMTGPLGVTSGYRAMEHCDALLMLGTDFAYRPFYPDDARTVQVDLQGENIGRRTHVRMTAHYRRTRRRLDGLGELGHADGPLHPQAVAAAVDRNGDADAVFLPDVGTPTLWAARYLHMNGQRRLLGSFTYGTMANALPQAIGVQATHPARQVVALSGDGGLTMLLGELLTLRQQQLP